MVFRNVLERNKLLLGGLALSCLLVMAAVGAQISTRSDDPTIGAAKASFKLPPAPRHEEASVEGNPAWRLGRSLFFETALSASGHIACVNCHAVDHAWSDGMARSFGDAGQKLVKRTPTLFGVKTLARLGWIGRFRDTTAVTIFALTSPGNMAQSLASAAERLRQKSEYGAAFREAFGSDPQGDTMVRALVTFVNSIEPAGSPFDRWIDGDETAIGPEAKRGFAIFVGKGRCSACHSGPTLTDGSFHDIGTSTDDVGRGALFKTSAKLQHAFKTPSLRGVADRAPYMHDGSRATLEDVVELYDRGGIERESRADDVKALHLSAGEKADLVAFMKSLSGQTRFAIR